MSQPPDTEPKPARKLWQRVQTASARPIKLTAYWAVVTAVIGYVVSFEDRIGSRQGEAWSTLRAAITWIESKKDNLGNVGQIDAIETLVHDCNWPWRGTFAHYIFDFLFPDCIDLKSTQLQRMELGGLHAAGANFSYANLGCANLAAANLRNANLVGTSFRAANLAGVDLSGAELTPRDADPKNPPDQTADADLSLADLTQVTMSSHTTLKPEQIKCACVEYKTVNGQSVPDINAAGMPPDIAAMMYRLHRCDHDRCGANPRKYCVK